MKRTFLILAAVAVAALIVVGGVFLRAQRSRLTTQVIARYPHQHLRKSEWEPLAKLPAGTYALLPGDSLAGVAERRYGHQNYAQVIKLHNHLRDAASVAAGTKLDLSDISDILAEEKLTAVTGPEVEMILCSRAKYDKVKDQLWTLRRAAASGTRVTLPESVKRELLEAADDLQQATDNLKRTKPGIHAAPAKMIRQLTGAMEIIRTLAEGSFDGYGYDIDIVQQRYANAIEYAIIWAREGFN